MKKVNEKQNVNIDFCKTCFNSVTQIVIGDDARLNTKGIVYDEERSSKR